MKAIWNNQVIAESDATIIVERNHYFPIEAVNKAYIRPCTNSTNCPWKGTAAYYTLEVDGKLNEGAAWYYPEPKEAAKNIKNYVAFWKGVTVVE